MRITPACLVITVLTVVSAGAQIEIAYDDGTAETGMVWNEPRNGLAVRFSVGPDSILTGAKFFTLYSIFGNPLGICVLDANGPDGFPGDTLCSYFEEPLDGPFQEVTFPAPIALSGADFYIVYLQTGLGGSDDSNTFGIDTSSPPDGRSWLFEDGVWSHMAPEEGDVIIRAIVTASTAAAPQTWGSVKREYR
jgi:hypothetical protein